MRILFARHGESEANVEEIISNRDLPHGLTEVGIAQTSSLAESLFDYDVRLIYASPILRARETAEIVAAKLDLPFQITDALREFDCGRMEGRHASEAGVAHQEVIRAWDEDKDYDRCIEPDGESFNDLKVRFLPFVAQLLAENRDSAGDILLISHGGMLHQMLPLVLANIDRTFTKLHRLGNCELVVAEFENDELFCLEWVGIKHRSY